MDRLQGMEAFVRVAELGSFSAAARQMGLSKSAVSKHLTALEECLGVRLINRTTRRLALTEVGLVYLDYCQRIIQEIEEAELTASRHGVEPRGRLKVNAPMSFGILHIAPLLPAFLARYPRIAVELTLNDRIVDLLEEGYDMAVRIGELADSSLIARRLTVARFVCAAGEAYLARAGTPEIPADLTRHNCLRYSYRRQPDGWIFLQGSEKVTVRVSGNMQANNGDALLAAAREGLGVVYLPDFIVRADLARGRLQPLLTAWQAPEIPIHAVFPPQRHPSAKLRAFVDFLVEQLGRRGGERGGAGHAATGRVQGQPA